MSCDSSPHLFLSPCCLPEHGDEQVDEQDVGDQQINDQQNYHQPVAIQNPARLGAGLNQCHVVSAGHVPLLPHWERHKDKGSLKYVLFFDIIIDICYEI